MKTGTERVREYYYDQARTLVNILDRILLRLNPRTNPIWLLSELHEAYHIGQCILAEREREREGRNKEG